MTADARSGRYMFYSAGNLTKSRLRDVCKGLDNYTWTLIENWNVVCGDEFRNCYLKKISWKDNHGTLHIGTKNKHDVLILSYKAQKLINSVNEFFGNTCIKDCRFVQ